MKKILYLIFALAAIALASCSSGPKNVPADPGEAAVYYFEFAKKADFDHFLDGFYFGPDVPESMINLSKEMIKKTLLEADQETADAMGKLKDLKIELLDSHIHGDHAHVKLRTTHPDEDPQEMEFEMQQIKGVWKIVVPM